MKKGIFFLTLITTVLPIIALITAENWISKNLEKSSQSYAWTKHTYNVLFTVEKLKNTINTAQLSLTAYLHTNRPSTLKKYSSQKKLLKGYSKGLKNLISDNPTQRKNMANFTILQSRLITHLDSVLINRDYTKLYSDGFIKLSKRINQSLYQIEHTEKKLLRQRLNINRLQRAATKENFLIFFYISLLILLVANIIIYYLFLKQKTYLTQITKLSDSLGLAADTAQLSIWEWNLASDTFHFQKFLFTDLPLSANETKLFERLKEHFLPEQITEIKKSLQKAFARKEKFIEAETVFLKSENDTRYLKSRAVINYDDNGKPNVLNGVTWDITELKKAAKIQQEAKEAAEEANKAKSRFLANISHEIRTPLNAIIGLNLLLKNTPLNEKQKDYVNKIYLSSINLLSIINDILDLSKIEAGKLQIEHTKFNLDLLLSNLAKLIHFNARQKGLELIFYQDPNIPPTLFGDPLRVSQILSNFLSNAIKFTERGQIYVSTKLVNKTSDNVILEFSVRDTGIGIDPQQLPDLFNSFTQADVSTTRKYGGTGLGLSICKQLVDMMGGKIWAESAKGKGSTFYFQLMFQYSEQKDQMFYQPPVELRNLRILVVDDIIDIRQMIQEQLKIFSNNVTTVGSFQQALAELRNALISGKKYFDLVILDWKLNGPENGLELAKKISTDPEIIIKPKIILMSAYIDRDYFDKESQYFDAFLTKPFTLSVLYNTILEVFGQEAKIESDTLTLQAILPKGLEGIRGAHFLVAEDNQLNQQVIKELLETQGMFVTLASNGKEAVEIVSKSQKPFDAILMDIQMPGMNGLDAAKQILANDKFKDLPIIALTADLAGNIKLRCQEAGIVDLISKPIDPYTLFSTVIKWIKPGQRITFKMHHTTKENENAIHYILSSIPELDYTKGLQRLNYNYHMYAELLIKFRKSYLSFPSDLRSALNQGDTDLFRRMAHTLKGVAGNLGLQKLERVVLELESALNNQEINTVQDLIDKVENELQKVLNHLQAAETQLKDYLKIDEDVLLSRGDVIIELQDSLILLQDFDAKAKEKIKHIVYSLKELGFADQANLLWNAVELYQFEEAAKIVKDILAAIEH